MNLSEKIKIVRQTKGLTQKKLSELAGIDVTSVQNYENNRSNPNREFMEKLCQYFPEYTLWLMTNDEKISVEQINPVAKNGGVNIGNNNAPITINNNNGQNNQNVEFINDELRKALFELHEDIFNFRKAYLGGWNSAKEGHTFVWSRLNNYMGVSSYKQIKLSNYQEAENFFNDWIMRYKGRTHKRLKEKYEKLKQLRECEKDTYFSLLSYMEKIYNTKILKDLTEEELTDVLVHFDVI